MEGADAMILSQTVSAYAETLLWDSLPREERLRKLVKRRPIMLFMKGTPAVPRCGFSRQVNLDMRGFSHW